MKFPKSVHAEGWAEHIDTTPGALSDTPKSAVSHPQGAKIAASAIRLNDAPVSPSLSTVPPPLTHSAAPAAPRVAQAAADRSLQRAAALPPQRQNQLSWMIAAGAGAAVIAAVTIWSMNRPVETPATSPAIVTGSAEPQAEVAAATPAPEAVPATPETAPVVEPATTVAAATPTPAEPAPARPAPSLTTVKPAPAETRQIAQADVPAPRPDLVLRANPRSAALEPLPAQLTPSTVATAPVQTPATIEPGTAPLTLPPTAAGPVAVTPPLASALPATPALPDAAAISTSPGTAPLAQAQLPAPTPVAEDVGITVQVRTALASDSTLAAVPIAVSTAQGVVKLEGQVPDAPTRERATVVASSAAGVKAVDNRLTLPPAPLLSQASGL